MDFVSIKLRESLEHEIHKRRQATSQRKVLKKNKSANALSSEKSKSSEHVRYLPTN